MAGMSIDKLKQILREKQLPADVEPPIEAMRKSMEKLAFKAADDIETEAVSVANRDAEWVRAPGSQAERAILYRTRRHVGAQSNAPRGGRNLSLRPSHGIAGRLPDGTRRALSGCG